MIGLRAKRNSSEVFLDRLTVSLIWNLSNSRGCQSGPGDYSAELRQFGPALMLFGRYYQCQMFRVFWHTLPAHAWNILEWDMSQECGFTPTREVGYVAWDFGLCEDPDTLFDSPGLTEKWIKSRQDYRRVECV